MEGISLFAYYLIGSLEYEIAIGQILEGGEGAFFAGFSVSEYLRDSITLKQHD